MKTGISISLALILFIFICSAGCGDNASGPGNAGANLIDPCDLITKAEAEQLMSEPLKDAEQRENPAVGQKICIYNAENDASFSLFQISITHPGDMPKNGQSPKAIYEAIKANFPESVKVDGIGDDAFIAPPGLHLIKDGYYISIAVGNSDDPENRKILSEAGKMAVEKLK